MQPLLHRTSLPAPFQEAESAESCGEKRKRGGKAGLKRLSYAFRRFAFVPLNIPTSAIYRNLIDSFALEKRTSGALPPDPKIRTAMPRPSQPRLWTDVGRLGAGGMRLFRLTTICPQY